MPKTLNLLYINEGKILVFEALNLPNIDVHVGKDPYLVTFCTEPNG